MSVFDVIVTDHCVMRYVERALGLDIEGIRESIAAVARPAAAMGATACIYNGVKLVIRDGAVVTALPGRTRLRNTKRGPNGATA